MLLPLFLAFLLYSWCQRILHHCLCFDVQFISVCLSFGRSPFTLCGFLFIFILSWSSFYAIQWFGGMMKKEKTLQDHIDFLKEGSLMTRRLPGGTTKMIWISLTVSEDSCSAEVRPSHATMTALS
jgi:hypothetical protein